MKLSAIPQASGKLGYAISGQDMFVIALLTLAPVAAVVLTTLGSGDKDRRKMLSPCSTASPTGTGSC